MTMPRNADETQPNQSDLLVGISEKIDLLVAVSKIAAQGPMERLKTDVAADKVARAILTATRKSIAYGDLVRLTVKKTGAGARTATRRISDLSAQGLIASERKGKLVYYKNSGLVW